MAQKRMFDKRITDSDRFTDLPNSSKALYFMAGMSADDRGFFQPRRLQKMCGFTDDDFKILIAKQYFISFESGVMVITDWNKNNYLDKNRITETEYVDELKLLSLINEKYELNNQCLTDVKRSFNQNSIEENSIEENSIEENSIEENSTKKRVRHKHGVYGRVRLTDNEYEKLIKDFTKEVVDRKIEQLDVYIEINNNKNKYSNFNLVLRKAINEHWFEGEKPKESKPRYQIESVDERNRRLGI